MVLKVAWRSMIEQELTGSYEECRWQDIRTMTKAALELEAESNAKTGSRKIRLKKVRLGHHVQWHSLPRDTKDETVEEEDEDEEKRGFSAHSLFEKS
jgi:hypothetical protein